MRTVLALGAACAFCACSVGGKIETSGSAASAPNGAAKPSTSGTPNHSPTPEPVATAPEPSTGWLEGDSESPNFPKVAGHALPTTSRVGSHEDFERVVVEYTGRASNITWQARLVDQPNPAGRKLSVPGTRFLRVTVAGVRDPDDGEEVPVLDPASLGGASMVKGVGVGQPSGGEHLLVIGLDADHPYRVMVLEDPTRLVVDLKR